MIKSNDPRSTQLNSVRSSGSGSRIRIHTYTHTQRERKKNSTSSSAYQIHVPGTLKYSILSAVRPPASHFRPPSTVRHTDGVKKMKRKRKKTRGGGGMGRDGIWPPTRTRVSQAYVMLNFLKGIIYFDPPRGRSDVTERGVPCPCASDLGGGATDETRRDETRRDEDPTADG